MKFSSFCVFALLLFGGCREKKFAGVDTTKNSSVVAIQLTTTRSYCGGARPPQEMLDELASPQPLAGKFVFIRKGTINNPLDEALVAQGTTDAMGRFEFSVQPGDYYLVFEEKKDNQYSGDLLLKYKTATSNYSAIDSLCVSEWMKQPDLLMQVAANSKNNFSLNLHVPCSWDIIPCIEYRGPLPP
jgi:hypothetical protein